MPIEDMIYTRLTATTALTVLVPSSRISPLVRPQGSTTPAIVYWKVSNPVEFMFNPADEMVQPRFQFDCYASSFGTARAVATQVKKTLDRWATSTGTPIIFRVDVENEFDDYDPDLQEYQSSVDVILQYLST